MRNAVLRVIAVLFCLAFVLSITSCGSKEGKEAKEGEKEAIKSERVEITPELYCKLQHEMVTIGVEKYYERLIGKEYKDVREIYLKYRNEREALYEKYKVEEADVNSYRSSYGNEIRDYLKEHPGLKWNDTEEKQRFNLTYAKLTWEWVEEEMNKRRGK
jgi:hypothetical protein